MGSKCHPFLFLGINPIASKLLSSRAYVPFGLTVAIKYFFLTKNQPILTTLPIIVVHVGADQKATNAFGQLLFI